jgi:beta-xylosidase
MLVQGAMPSPFALALLLLAAAPVEPPLVPVYKTDSPDPFIVEHEGEYLAYSTNSGATNLPIASSRDLVAWTPVADPAKPKKRLDAMPVLAPWVEQGRTWAPEVLRLGSRWLLYYTARDRKKQLQCVGVAAADNPRGPFRDTSSEPLVCQKGLGGTIDANPFRDADGKLYLYFKNDGNAVRKPTHIWGLSLSADGMSVSGEPFALLTNDQKWEAHVVEAPTMVRRPDGGYTMFYSANHFGWEPDQRLSAYAMGYATCRTPRGPCTDSADNPILHSYNDKQAGCLSGPGHQMLFETRGRHFIAFHAWSATASCGRADKGRYMYIAPLRWQGGKPILARSLRPAR